MKSFTNLLIISLFSISVIGCASSVKVEENEDASSHYINIDAIKNSYTEKRLLTLVNHWLALVENPDRRPEPFKDIIAEEIYFDFSSGAIENYQDLKAWVNGPASSVAYSKHDLSEFNFETTGENQYTLYVTMDWQGLLPNGDHMTAKTRHKWTVQDTPSEIFARIKTIEVEMIKPFSVTQFK